MGNCLGQSSCKGVHFSFNELVKLSCSCGKRLILYFAGMKKTFDTYNRENMGWVQTTINIVIAFAQEVPNNGLDDFFNKGLVSEAV